MTTNDFIQQCKNSGKFNYSQMEQIHLGFKNGLSIEQVKFYADFKFNYAQMFQIRYGIEQSLPMGQVKLYAKPEFDWKQMYHIREFITKNNITDMSINTIRFLLGLNCI